MAGELEGIGDAVTAGVWSRAAEPRAGEPAADGHTHESACLNCGTRLRGEYCHTCGQRGHVHRTLGAFGHDLLHGVLHFEGKIWRTLPMLAWHPGQLTRRYIEGERARFVSPLALFLFCVFLMFAVFGWTGGIGLAETDAFKVNTGIGESIKATNDKIADAQKERAEAAAAGESTDKLDKQLAELRDEASMLAMMRDKGIAEATMARASDDLPGKADWLQRAYAKAKKNPALLLYKLQNSAYKYSWALIPISVPFIWLLFPFSRKYRLYDHTVFVTYSLCFMTLLAVVLDLLYAAGARDGWIGIPLTIIPPIHMYRQLRGAYRLRWWSALLRTLLLVAFAWIAAVMFALLLLALGVLG